MPAAIWSWQRAVAMRARIPTWATAPMALQTHCPARLTARLLAEARASAGLPRIFDRALAGRALAGRARVCMQERVFKCSQPVIAVIAAPSSPLFHLRAAVIPSSSPRRRVFFAKHRNVLGSDERHTHAALPWTPLWECTLADARAQTEGRAHRCGAGAGQSVTVEVT
jgi:hypothetical protein